MKKRLPLRRRLFVVAVAAVVPLTIMSGFALYAGYQQQRQQAQRAGLDIARALTTAVSAELRRTVSVLQVLASSRAIAPEAPVTAIERARLALTAQTDWRAITLADARGAVILDTRVPEGDAPLPIADVESLQKVIATNKPVVGSLVRGPDGRFAFAVRVPVLKDGELHNVLSAVLDPKAILNVLNAQRVPGDWVVAVADAKGIRVARTRASEQTVGTPFSPSFVEMMSRMGPEGSGVTYATEGDPVFTAYSRSADFGWTTAVGQPTALVEAVTRQSFATFGTGILLSTLLGILAAFFAARRITNPIMRLRESAVGMGRGEPYVAPPMDLQELHDVSVTLANVSEQQAAAHAEREEILRREQAARSAAETARSAAEAANRAKDEFLAMLGHELRNPIGAISNAANLLESGQLGPEESAQTRAIIARQSKHLARMTDDLLDAGRALTGKVVLRTSALDLSEIAMQSLTTLKSANRLNQHEIIEDLSPVWVEADAVRLDQIIANLVVNAVKYTPAGGTIRIEVRPEGKEALLKVADNGIGLDPQLASRVFDLFVQGARDLDRSEGGLGIGLTLVHRLAELHGGSVGVQSDGVGKGSTFTVRLPSVPAPPAAHARDRAPQGLSRHVLVVEDNPDARETLRLLLELSGHRVDSAADGQSGLDMALALRPQVALIDVGLPRIDGYEVARRLRARMGDQRPFLVALTGYGSAEDRERALAAGFDEHVVKPVDPEALASLLATPAIDLETS